MDSLDLQDTMPFVDWTLNGFAMELLDTILATQNQIGLPKQPTKTL
jgi:hypothetical protein